MKKSKCCGAEIVEKENEMFGGKYFVCSKCGAFCETIDQTKEEVKEKCERCGNELNDFSIKQGKCDLCYGGHNLTSSKTPTLNDWIEENTKAIKEAMYGAYNLIGASEQNTVLLEERIAKIVKASNDILKASLTQQKEAIEKDYKTKIIGLETTIKGYEEMLRAGGLLK
jgi:paraquat-inducible protein B